MGIHQNSEETLARLVGVLENGSSRYEDDGSVPLLG